MAIKEVIAINGPNGIACPTFFLLNINRIADIVPPMMNDTNKVNIVSLTPSHIPSKPISLMSPPPIPPFVMIATNNKNPPPINRPKVLFIISLVLL